MKQTSWTCTLTIQFSLCIAVYIALNIGHPQTPPHPHDLSIQPVYFITVAGGFRRLQEQALLLQLIGKAAKAFKARFVIDITEFGRSDPLLQKCFKISDELFARWLATMIPELQNIPWYITGVSGEQGETFFLKKIEAPYGQTTDIVVLDTTLFQGTLGVRGSNQSIWLTETLNETSNDRRIIVGYHNLISCNSDPQKMEEDKVTTSEIQDILLSHSVEAYISTIACIGSSPDEGMELSLTCLDTENQKAILNKETFNGFLIHRISPMEMATLAVTLTGEIKHKISCPQRGRAAM